MAVAAIDRVLRNSSGSTSNGSSRGSLTRSSSSSSSSHSSRPCVCLRHRHSVRVRRRCQRAFRRLDLAAQCRTLARRRVQRAAVRGTELVGALLVLQLQVRKLRLVLMLKLLTLQLILKLKLVVLLLL